MYVCYTKSTKTRKKRYFTLYYIRQRIPKKETTEKISGCIEGGRVRLETMSGKVQADDPLRWLLQVEAESTRGKVAPLRHLRDKDGQTKGWRRGGAKMPGSASLFILLCVCVGAAAAEGELWIFPHWEICNSIINSAISTKKEKEKNYHKYRLLWFLFLKMKFHFLFYFFSSFSTNVPPASLFLWTRSRSDLFHVELYRKSAFSSFKCWTFYHFKLEGLVLESIHRSDFGTLLK